MIDDIEIKAVKKATTGLPSQQEEETVSVDWRIVGIISAALVLAVCTSVLAWNAHGWFVHPTFAKARAEIESRFGADTALAFEEATRACPDDASLTRACGLLHEDMRRHPDKLASATIKVPNQ